MRELHTALHRSKLSPRPPCGSFARSHRADTLCPLVAHWLFTTRLPCLRYVSGMGTIRAQVILHTDDNTPANYVTNSFAFTSPGVFADFTGLTAVIKDFYDDITVTYLSTELAQNGHEIKYYDLPGTPPNYPVEEDVWNMAALQDSDAPGMRCMSLLPGRSYPWLSAGAPSRPHLPGTLGHQRQHQRPADCGAHHDHHNGRSDLQSGRSSSCRPYRLGYLVHSRSSSSRGGQRLGGQRVGHTAS